MNSSITLRTALVTLALAVGSYGVASLLAEATSSKSSIQLQASSTTAGEPAAWLMLLSPLRSDLESNNAQVVARLAVQQSESKPSSRSDEAILRAKTALAASPFNAALWLALAQLEMQRDRDGPTTIEALKMAYLTAPNNTTLIPTRLHAVTKYDALLDPDLQEMARGDVRALVLRQNRDQIVLSSSYQAASNRGRAFLEETVRSIDPTQISALTKK